MILSRHFEEIAELWGNTKGMILGVDLHRTLVTLI